MGLDHDFLLLDRETDGEWELLKFIHDPRSIHLHDDLMRYLGDTFAWIPTYNPSRSEPDRGFSMWGVTTIQQEGASLAERIFERWADLFSLGPPELALTGCYSWADSGGESPPAANVTQLEGGYDLLKFDRDEVVGVLRQLANWCGRVRTGDGRCYLLHQGI